MPDLKKHNGKTRSSNLFPVVGVGASAGGLDAFKRLLKAIPENSGMAYILVQHLDPGHDSILSELLQRVTKIPVQEITDNIHVVPDHIYIIPSNKLLTATDGILQLSARLPKTHKNLPIDLFFSSLAEVHQNHAIGVVLSGTASDGTQGLKAIKAHGGITIAQSLQSAAFDEMPQSAIDAGVVDFILTPEEIPGKLLLINDSVKIDPDDEAGDAARVLEAGFKQILSLLRIRKGVDFTYYKQPTIRRRIARRMALCMKPDITEYLAYLKDNKAEQDTLYQDLLIPVTQFFRDPKVFENLVEKVCPGLLKDRQANEPIRIWSAGCSTGEEAYSLVMCFQEYLANTTSNIKIQVFATDISEMAIAKARSGIYSTNEITGLSAARIKQYFTRTDGKYRLNKNIRDTCVFAHHNYLKDPPFARIDLISCRNSLIYLEPFLQKKALTTFHYALAEKGVLQLGKSETAGQATDLFNTFDKTSKFYTRKAVRGNFLVALGDRKEEVFKVSSNGIGNGKYETRKDDFQKSGDDLLLSKYVPPGVIVNDIMDIVQFRGATGTWLEPSPGTPSLNVLKMAREGLAFELRSALHKVKKNKETPVIKENIPIQFAGRELLVTIEVIALPDTIEPYFLVLFRDTSVPAEPTPENADENGRRVKPDSKKNKEQLRSRKLQKELAQVREDMRSLTEDQEAANEELQSANEEMLSGSEELQSLNEELETSKEEIQTTNEELIIVNQELYDRNEQLNHSRLYAESIVTTIREPLMILTKELKVKSANKSFYDKFETTDEATVGNFIFDLGNKQWDVPDLRKLLRKMLVQKTGIVDFVVAHNFPGIGDRVMLLNAAQIVRDHGEEQSILIAIEDVTERRRADSQSKVFSAKLEKEVLDRTFSLQEANTDLQLSNENLEQFAYIASHDLQEPLRKIRVFSTMLQDKYYTDLPEGVQVLINKISGSSERMSTLIRELLNFSKILHDDSPFKQTSLDDILSKVLEDFSLVIEDKKVVIHRDPLPVVDAVPFQINQLFYNLISNSIKFSRDDIASVIRITSHIPSLEELATHTMINPKYSYCEISIKDNGIGFKQQFSDQIFLVFHRLHSTKQFPGTGIGLALCRKIVANHHGELVGISKENEGALFKILLPLSLKT